MEGTLLQFAALLRAAGVRVSTGEVVDGMRAGAAVALRDRETLKLALGVTMVKDVQDWPLFSDLYDRFFRLQPLPEPGPGDHEHGHDELRDELSAERVTLSEEPAPTPQSAHDHGKPADIRDYFDERDLASAYNLHQAASKVDMASMTPEVVLADRPGADLTPPGRRLQLETDRLHDAWAVGDLAAAAGTHVGVGLEVAAQPDPADTGALDAAAEAELRRRVDALLGSLPELLKRHVEALAAQHRQLEHRHDPGGSRLRRVSETDRLRMEEALRRLARRLHGALTHRRTVARSGRVDVCRTMRRNLRHDGVPFTPVTVARKEDRPRLVVLADVSLSVRNSARFTLHLVHGLQRLFPRVRTFVFVDDLAEVTELFEDHPLETALDLVFDGALVDVDANSDYGHALGRFVDDHLAAVTHRTSVLVLGDGRGNGHDPNLAAFETVARRARRVVWLTPEPRYSWVLGRCDLPLYAQWCQTVSVVHDVDGLDSAAAALSTALTRSA